MPAEVAVAAAVTEDLHAWEAGGAQSAEALSAWVGARLAAHEAALAALLAVEEPRTPKTPCGSMTRPSSTSVWLARRPASSTPWPPTKRFAIRRRRRPSAWPWPAAP